MVVAIHCFPFQTISKELDTLVTLTVFRIAVPFFFMVSGYYLLGPILNSATNTFQINSYIKKQLKVYIFAILLYLPLAFYSQTITLNMSIVSFIKQLLFSGFFYHLWFFPAWILGLLIVQFLLKRMNIKTVLFITFVAYLIGLGGDSWWGIVKHVPFFFRFYNAIFQLFDYTRNGLFYAPLFFTLGAYLHKMNIKNFNSTRNNYLLLLFSIEMILESYFLHLFNIPKHDSMYLFLPFVMTFMFIKIYNWAPKNTLLNSSQLSLGVYLIHPYIIAVVHFISIYISIFTNSIINYSSVLLISYLTMRLIIKRKEWWKTK